MFYFICVLLCSVCRRQHMLRYTSESLESNLRCLFNLNFNTGNLTFLHADKHIVYQCKLGLVEVTEK